MILLNNLIKITDLIEYIYLLMTHIIHTLIQLGKVAFREF